ncbi:unnamed protein product [Adineta steineri]|uniref:MICOS complex subunit MIC10 n=1 Tax=Adineta steineri TaxID=433720 RepID=A0A818Z5P2_9BILA|nr:unnamed protein product [Adineta steineri]CAF3764138.1 unnamed protein product [Adineta steineri]
MASRNRLVASEDVNGEKWDRCLTDTVVKTASGLALGIVFSAILFKRRPWPVFLGTGIGIGMGYSNCQNDLRSPHVHSSSIPTARPDRHVPTKPSDN